jgi:membrane protein implicated in regulation of membrane protease activity
MDSLRASFLRPELIWFLVGLLLLFVEMAIPGFVIGFFALGAWIVAVVTLCRPLTLNQELALFISTSVLSLALARSWLKGVFTGFVKAEQETDADLGEFVGQRAAVTKTITAKRPGKVEFHGVPWQAVADQEIAAGAVVEIVAKDNLTLKVKVV